MSNTTYPISVKLHEDIVYQGGTQAITFGNHESIKNFVALKC